MGPLRCKGSESQDRLYLKEEIIMYEDIFVKGSLTTTKNNNNEVCLLGKLEWHLNHKGDMGVIKHSHVIVLFNNLEVINAMKIFKTVKEMRGDSFEFNKKYYLVDENGIRIHVNDDTSFKHFKKAIRHLFGFAIAEMAENGIKVVVDVTTNY